jgi:hypothetical protein
MRTGIALVFGVAALSAVASGQARPTAPASAPERRYVVIGCVSRAGTAAAPRYLLTDTRGDAPTVYRLEGDRATLDVHVGHQVEAKGPLTQAPAAGRAAAATPTLKVTSLVWISTTCPPAPR